MEFRRRSAVALLLAALLVLVLASVLTRGGDPSLEYNAPPSLPNTSGLVDQSPLATARTLAALAATVQEQEYANQALRFADHEVDQAFASALRDATTHQPALSGEALSISKRMDALAAKIAQEQQRIQQQQAAVKASKGGAAVVGDAGDLDLQVAQLALDQDQLDDLRADLIRVGGDRRARIQQALDDHQSLEKQAGTIAKSSQTAQLISPAALATLAGKMRAYSSLQERRKLLDDARAHAEGLAKTLNAQRAALEKQIEAASGAGGDTNADAAQVRASTLNSMRALSEQRKSLAELDSRIHDLEQLGDVYKNWSGLVASQKLTVLHRMVRVFSFIVGIVMVVLAVDAAIRGFFRNRLADRRRLQNVRLVLQLCVQLAGLGVILMIIFGPPQQMTTIIGLTTAGLTVALKDFIIAFIGWFALMGKNGIRVGDWVEINGVSGEVMEIGLLRTVLLETGNWTDPGHPTGRRVAFMNGFAIEGHYFNFSTTGQWLWDELRVTVPAGEHAFADVEAIREAVVKRTAEDSKLAEQEWSRATGPMGLPGFSASAAIDVRPGAGGLEAVVRYITRAQKRLEMRSALYQDVIQILRYATGEARTAS